MNKLMIFSLSALLATNVAAVAQEDPTRRIGTLTSKGMSIIPEAKDFAIGIDATPFLNYIGNVFTSGSNQAPTFNGLNGALSAKYFLTDKTAVRAKLILNFSNSQDEVTVADDYRIATNPLDVNATTVDYRDFRNSNIELRLGYEMRRGYGRLQGFYGGELIVGTRKNVTDYTYGNKMTALNQSPTAAWGNGNARPIEEKSNTTLNLGLGAFAGVEYFIAPKIAIGGELGLSFYTNNVTKLGSNKYETFNYSANAPEVIKDRWNQSGNSSRGITTVTSGSIFLQFHF